VPVPGSDNNILVAVGISKAVVQTEGRAEFQRNLLWITLFTMVSLLGAGFVADRSVLRHLRRLNEASRRLASGVWDTRARFDNGAIEFQQLGRLFEDMAAALKQHQDHLEGLVKERTAELLSTNEALNREIAERKRAEEEEKCLVRELQGALTQVKTLHGLLPICARCKKIRDDHGYWSQLESYISKHSDAKFSHSLCPECVKHDFPELLDELQDEPPASPENDRL